MGAVLCKLGSIRFNVCVVLLHQRETVTIRENLDPQKFNGIWYYHAQAELKSTQLKQITEIVWISYEYNQMSFGGLRYATSRS